MAELPPCGIYRTTVEVAGVPAERLVFFHNHGEPGPGIYAPKAWAHNRAEFSAQGTTLPDAALASTLLPLPAEGFYVVTSELVCCEKQCHTWTPDSLVQLGYNGEGAAILFSPSITAQGLAVPERGTRIDDAQFAKLKKLHVHVDLGTGAVH